MTRNFLTIAAALLPLCSSIARAAPTQVERGLPARGTVETIRVGEKLDKPRLRPGVRIAPQTQENTMNKIAASIESRFTQAAGSSSNLLTKQQALASGWGWASDHFAEIDPQNKGAVSLDDVLNYIARKSGAVLPRRTSSSPVPVIQ